MFFRPRSAAEEEQTEVWTLNEDEEQTEVWTLNEDEEQTEVWTLNEDGNLIIKIEKYVSAR